MSLAQNAAPLGPADELLLHQMARPFGSVAEQTRSWFDRFYFNLHPPEPHGPTLVIGASRYANAGVMDGYACMVHDGEQRNLRFARRVASGDAPTTVGPLVWEILEPLRSWRLRLNAESEGFELDVVWTARTEPYAVSPITVAHEDGVATDFSHFFQPGRYEGQLTIDGVCTDVSGWFGMRDRSWGVRRTRELLGLHLWGGAQLGDRCVAVLYNEDRNGNPVHVEGVVLSENGDAPVAVTTVGHNLHLDSSGELVEGVVRLALTSGEEIDVEWAGSGPGLYMSAAGYDGWHGQDRGDAYEEHERWQLDGTQSPNTLPISLVNKLCECRVGGDTGTGIFELAVSRSASYTYRPTFDA